MLKYLKGQFRKIDQKTFSDFEAQINRIKKMA